jgi:hypothetical protein
MYNDELKGLLELNQNIASVWINEAGEWFTSKTENCKEVTRDVILSDKTTKKVKTDE